MEIILLLGFYLLGSWALAKIGAKFGVGTTIQYFIPIYSQVLICRCAQVSPWWTLGMFLPYVGVAVIVYVFGTLATRLGKNFWLHGLGSLILCIPVFVMAFDNSQPVKAQLQASSEMNV